MTAPTPKPADLPAIGSIVTSWAPWPMPAGVRFRVVSHAWIPEFGRWSIGVERVEGEGTE